MAEQLIVLSIFDYTTAAVKPWADAGFLCYCVDTQHPTGERREGNIVRVGADVDHWVPPRGRVVFASFFPPCTDVAVSGARWFKDKGLRRLSKAIGLFARSVEIAESLECPYYIENPVSTISSYWRKPNYTFDPCDYGDPYTKKTCLWTGGGFVMQDKKPVPATEGSKMHKLPPSAERANLRSATPEGFARAVFESNYIKAAHG
jgi:hypothetical protein